MSDIRIPYQTNKVNVEVTIRDHANLVNNTTIRRMFGSAPTIDDEQRKRNVTAEEKASWDALKATGALPGDVAIPDPF